MRITLNWLKDYLKTDNSADEIAVAFNRIGHEVEAVETTGYEFNNVVVGKVLSTEKHPDADKLNICQVQVDDGPARQIICGAPNVRAGLTVAVATEGAVLPGDFKIKKAKIRGVESNGMICSVRELQLGDEHNGIWEMETDAKIGTPLNDILPKADTVFDLGITPNRGDALSVLGLARDLAAGGMGAYHETWQEKFGDEKNAKHGDAAFTPGIETDGCTFFCGLSVRGIDNTKQTPDWMKQRLEAAGLRPINAAADVSQYVMLTIGQPLHHYDGDKVSGSIKATEAKGGEKLNGLDGSEHTLNKGDLVIADDKGILGLAGIVGGEESSSTESTTHVYIEAAQFDADRIALTGQAHQIHSDARYRFERGIDPSKTLLAALVSAHLLQSICGGEISHVAKTGTQMPKAKTISFDPNLVKTFGGLDLDAKESKRILESLGFDVKGEAKNGGVFDVTVPPHLTAHENPEDLIEDILRIHGYDNVPTVLPTLNLNPITDAAPTRSIEIFTRRHMAGLGYFEGDSYRFISEKAAKLFGGGDASLKLTNPIDAATMSDMRPSILPCLLSAAERNKNRGEQSIRLAEVGMTFHPEADKKQKLDHTETLRCAALLVGDYVPRNPHLPTRKADVFAIKAHALSFIEALGHDLSRMMIKQEAPKWFHPTRSGTLIVQGRPVGYFGQIHPQVARQMGVKDTAYAFELDLSLLNTMNVKPGAFVMSQYQPVRRDFAFMVDSNVAAADLMTTVRKASDKSLLQDVQLFDVYEGDKLPEGKKSVALSITLQAEDRTLKDDDINAVADKVIALAAKNHGAEIRG